jgi:hypothetical protein
MEAGMKTKKKKKKKKSGKASSSPTDFFHFKDFPRPLNQKYYGSRKKKSTFP